MPSTSSHDLEKNKKLALDFLEHSFKGEADAAIALLAPDATWWVIGNPEKIKVSGVMDMPRIRRLLEYIGSDFPNGMDATYEGITAEGDRVAIEVKSEGHTKKGQRYANRYHFLLTISGQQVTHIREYMDTQFVYEFQNASK